VKEILTEHEEEEGVTLEEQVKILQEQGLPREKIVEQIFDEDLSASVDILSNLLNMGKLDIGRIKGRISRIKKRQAEKEKPKEEVPPEGAESVYKGELDVNSILNDILSRHPDINPKVREEVMDWAKMKGGLQPTELVYILQSMRGISSTTANIIASKYSFALNKAIQEGKLQLPPTLGVVATQSPAPPQFFMPPFQQQQQGFQPPSFQPPSPGQQTQTTAGQQFGQPYGYGYGYPPAPQPQQDIRNMIREEVRLSEERKKEPVSEQYVDIYEPVKNEEGQVIVNEEGQPIMKRIHVPVSQAAQFAPKEDTEARVLEKIERYKKIFGSELTESKIREIVRQEAPQPTAPSVEKPVTLEDVQKVATDAASTAAQQVQETYEKKNEEERRHKEIISAIQQQGSARAVEGYKDDGFRMMGQGMSEVAKIAGDRKPIEVIIKEGGRILFPSAPGEKQVEVGAGEGILARLRNRGWVAEQ